VDPGDRLVEDQTQEIAGMPVFWRSAPWEGSPVVYLHGVPTSSDDWVAFLARTGGVAPDLPGFGRSAKRGDFDYTIAGYRDFLGAFLDHLGVERFRLVVHDWGAVGLALAQEQPERVERLVISNAVPLLPGYRWHRIARVWRTRGLGELSMGATTRWGFRQLSREANATPGPLPADMVDSIWRHFDQGTQRAILRLYRSSAERVLATAGERLKDITAPALVLWGEADPYIPPRFATAYAAGLGNAEVRLVSGAGHWPWLDRPELIEEASRFLAGGRAEDAAGG
jgi:pimeloyl-ACP methyl ester carboxylesterase